MSRERQPLWNALLRAAVVEGETPPAAPLASPWYVKLLLAASGWLASILLLCFLALFCKPILKESTIAGGSGGAMLLVAFGLLRIPKNAFVEHLALALSLAGQALVSFWIFDQSQPSEMLNWLWLLLLQMALVALMPHFIHRVLSAFVAGVALFMSLMTSGWSFAVGGTLMAVSAWCWLNEWRYPSQMRLVQAIGYGLALALVALHAMELTELGHPFHFAAPETVQWAQPWMGEAMKTAVMLALVGMLLQHSGQAIAQPPAIMALLGTTVLGGLAYEVHGLSAGIMLMLLGFAGANRVLLGLGIASLLAFLCAYYYLLDQTLLVKSGSLCAVGLGLLLFRWCMLRFLGTTKATRESNHG